MAKAADIQLYAHPAGCWCLGSERLKCPGLAKYPKEVQVHSVCVGAVELPAEDEVRYTVLDHEPIQQIL